MTTKKAGIIACVILVGYLLYVLASYQLNGYCWDRGMYVPQEEKLLAAISASTVGSRKIFFNVKTDSGVENRNILVKLAPDPETFLENNPDCCVFDYVERDPDSPPPKRNGVISRLFGFYWNAVIVSYDRPILNGPRVGNVFADGEYFIDYTTERIVLRVNKCGKAWRTRY